MEQSGETTNLAVIDDGEAVFVEQVQCRELMRMSTKLGARAPLHASGVGKAMLAAMDDGAVDAALAGAGSPGTRRARSPTARRLRANSRPRASAATRSTTRSTPRACAASPRLWDENGEPWAAISLAGPTSRITPQRVPGLGVLVRSAAADLTAALGGHPPRLCARADPLALPAKAQLRVPAPRAAVAPTS